MLGNRVKGNYRINLISYTKFQLKRLFMEPSSRKYATVSWLPEHLQKLIPKAIHNIHFIRSAEHIASYQTNGFWASVKRISTKELSWGHLAVFPSLISTFDCCRFFLFVFLVLLLGLFSGVTSICNLYMELPLSAFFYFRLVFFASTRKM